MLAEAAAIYTRLGMAAMAGEADGGGEDVDGGEAASD